MRFREILNSARITFLKNFFSAKNILALLLVFSTVHYVSRDLVDVCKTYSANVQPLGLFAFTTTSYYTCFMFLFSFLLMVCDAPFLDDIQTQVILRTGRKSWVLGQLLYIAVLNLLFWLFVLLSCYVNVIGHIDPSFSWGKIFTSLASHTITLAGFTAQAQIINNYTLPAAFIYAFTLNLLLTFLLGSIVFCVNLATDKRIGVVIPAAFIMFHFQFVGGFGFTYALLKFSPVSLANLMLLDPRKKGVFPTHRYAYCFFAGTIAIMLILSLRAAKNKSFCESRY